MSLRHAVLAVLLDGEASGYDLAKEFDHSVANFWTARAQQIYRELDGMAADGLIQARSEQQARRPTKRLYTLTDAGHAFLRAFTTQLPKPVAIRDELLVQAHAIDAGDGPAVREAIIDRAERAKAKLVHYERRKARLLDGRDEQTFLEETHRLGPYLTLLRGIFFEEETVRWAQLALELIDKRSGHTAASEQTAAK